MQNTYQEKIGDLEANNALVRKKLEGGIKFKIKSSFQPAGDQPEAIKKILKNLKEKYSVKDNQDLLAMCAIQLGVKLEKLSLKDIDSKSQINRDILDIQKQISSIM